MMQEYTLPATPAHARRLLELMAVTDTELTEDIGRLALQDFVTTETWESLPYPTTQVQRRAAQRLLDYGMRGVLLTESDETSRISLLAAIALSGIRPIVVSSNRAHMWVRRGTTFGLRCGTDFDDQTLDLLVVPPEQLVHHRTIDKRRDGLLIVDQDETNQFHNEQAVIGPSREFQRTIVVCNLGFTMTSFHGWSRNCESIVTMTLQLLWPRHVLDILDHTTDRAMALRSRGFKKVRPAELYFLFNVVPDLLGDKSPK